MPRILVVEDSPTQAAEINFFLEEAGYQVETAGHGRDALAIIGRAPPDVVVTDLQMPEMDGLELVEAVRRDHAPLPIILMTAHGSEDIAARALRHGAASYVPKRDLEQDLVPTLERILALTRSDRHHSRALDCLSECESRFTLHNDPALIPPIIAHLEEIVTRLNLCDRTELMRVSIALQESLLNAMDHGNLEVSSELRQRNEADYHDKLRQRRLQKPYQDRRVYFTARVSPAEAAYVIRDEGPGFDPATLPDPTDPANLERVGGRGLFLVRTFMDTVYHNPRGNEITMIKRRGH